MRFTDEYCHLVGGMMLNRGAILYRTFIEQHGPVTFMLTQAYGAMFGWKQANFARLIPALMVLGAAVCVAFSTALRTATSRLWAAALFIGLLASIWLVQGLYCVSYHTIGGAFMVAAVALLVAPAWLGAPVTPGRAGLAGGCCVMAAGTAYPFAPVCGVLACSGLWAAYGTPGLLRGFAGGAGAALVIMLAWMLRFADIPGYISYHIIENQLVFSKYVTGWGILLAGITPAINRDALVNTMGLLAWVMALAGFLALACVAGSKWRAAPVVLGFMGLVPLLARGTQFQDGAFLMVVLALLSIVVPLLIPRFFPFGGQRATAAGTLMIGLCLAGAEIVARHAHFTPFSLNRDDAITQPRFTLGQNDDPISRRIRALTAPNDRILAVPFQPGIYMQANRMPMAGYYYYLPWNADYAANPWLVPKHDLCADLAAAPPALIDFNNWNVWNRYWMASYAPCFIEFLGRYYRRDDVASDVWVRR